MKHAMIKPSLLLILLGLTLTSSGQNNASFSYYMFNLPYYNPGAVRFYERASVAFQYRSQWLGYNTSFDGRGGAPTGQLLSATIPTDFFLSGVGLNVLADDLGPVNNLSASFILAHTLNLAGGDLSIGISSGIISQTQKFNELRFNDPRDPFNIGTRETQLKPNIGAGLFFKSNSNYYAGVGVRNILKPSFDFSMEGLQNKLQPIWNGTFGLSKVLNRDLTINPSLLVRSDLVSFTFDASVMTEYKKMAWGGVSYRRDEAVIFLIGYSFLREKNLKIGYALDYVVNEREAKQPTSHELYVRYDLPDFIFGSRKEIKTPRYTY